MYQCSLIELTINYSRLYNSNMHGQTRAGIIESVITEEMRGDLKIMEVSNYRGSKL